MFYDLSFSSRQIATAIQCAARMHAIKCYKNQKFSVFRFPIFVFFIIFALWQAMTIYSR